MASIFEEIGYLEADYLVEPYFEGTAFVGLPLQIDRIIASQKTVYAQVEKRIDDSKSLYLQVEKLVSGQEKQIATQIERLLLGEGKDLYLEVDRKIDTSKTVAFEMQAGGLLQGSCGHDTYLENLYLVKPYLTDVVCVRLPMQMDRRVVQYNNVKSQVNREITTTKNLGIEVDRRIDSLKDLYLQLEARQSKKLYLQMRKVLYNTFNLRILSDFPSRGTNGTNWTLTSGSAAAGDFGINNVNTDVVEQCFRSTSATNVTMVCDTGVSNGVFVDTIGILNHNLRVSATIQVEGSQSITFSNPVVFNLQADITENLIWVAPTIPLASYRYWRFSFADAGNPAGYIQIGTIVFGSSLIFQGENVVDTIVKTPKHFADKIISEGFTTVNNDRALKNSVSLEFRNLDFNRENYTLLQQVLNTCRTSLKALWIPTPRKPTRFGIFGKIAAMPSEQHVSLGDDADYISFTLEVDESL